MSICVLAFVYPLKFVWVPRDTLDHGGLGRDCRTRCPVLEPVRPEAVLPDNALCLPTLNQSVILIKTYFMTDMTRAIMTISAPPPRLPTAPRGVTNFIS